MKLLCIIVLFACSCPLQAQRAVQDFKKFGLQAGAGISNMNFNQGSPSPVNRIDPSWKAGVTIGLLMRIPITGRWWLQPEYNYVQRNGTDKSIATGYKLDYVSLPVLLHYQTGSSFSVYAGLQGDLLIHASSSSNGTKTNITHDTEERSLAITGGVEFRIFKSLFLSGRYMQGFNHIGIGQRFNVKEFKYQSVNATVGISF